MTLFSRFALKLKAPVRCRLCSRIALTVFVSIVIVEAAILVPSYRDNERDLYLHLESAGRMAILGALRTTTDLGQRDLLAAAPSLLQDGVIKGARLYTPSGLPFGSFGEPPAMRFREALRSGNTRLKISNPRRYEVLWDSNTLQAPFGVVARLDSEWIAQEMRFFSLRMAASVLLLSCFVAGITLWVVSRLLLTPILNIHQDLAAATENLDGAEGFVRPPVGDDELGEITSALNLLFHQVSEARRNQLKQSEERLKAIIDHMPSEISLKDKDGRYLLVNRLFETCCGLDRAEIEGKTPGEVLTPDAAAAALSRHRAVVDSGEPLFLEDERQGEWGTRVYLTGEFPVPGNRGNDLFVGTISSDITLRKDAEQALRSAKEEAEASSLAKSQFLMTMSHELRTPLNAIIGFSELMAQELHGELGSPRYQDYAQDIQGAGVHLLGIINDILDLSKVEAGKFELRSEVCEPDGIARSALTLMTARAFEAGVVLVDEIAPDLPAIFADGRVLKQILLNLLSNALKFTPRGGRVTLSVWVNEAGQLAFVVTDTGIGIEKSDLAKVMSPFGQVDSVLSRKYGGTGLGLPLAKSLTELHDGRLEIQSVLSEGTRATVTLPPERLAGNRQTSRDHGIKTA